MAVNDEVVRLAADAADRIGPAVVRVGRGGGLVVAEGKVLTNAHNLHGEEAEVVFPDGRSVTASLLGVDLDGDLAVLAAGTGTVVAPQWREEGAPALGTVVLAVSARLDGGLRVTVGTVSATGRAFRGPGGRLIGGAIEHTAPLARGSSGTPLVGPDGRVAGLNTHRIASGFYLAQRADAGLARRVEALGRGVSGRRVRLGVALVPPHAAGRLRAAVGLPPRDGLLVRAVEAGGLADRAGIREGDLIVGAASVAVASVDDLHGALDGLEEGGTLQLRVVRGVEEVEITVVATPDG